MIKKTMISSKIQRFQYDSPFSNKIFNEKEYVILQVECDSTDKNAYMVVEYITKEDFEREINEVKQTN